MSAPKIANARDRIGDMHHCMLTAGNFIFGTVLAAKGAKGHDLLK